MAGRIGDVQIVVTGRWGLLVSDERNQNHITFEYETQGIGGHRESGDIILNS